MLTRSEIDQALIRYADTMRLAQLSYKIDGQLTPEQCGARLAHLLEAPDWLTATQQDQLITHKMRLIISELEDMPRTTRNAEVILNGLEKVGAPLDKREAANEADLKRHYSFEGTVLLHAVQAFSQHVRKLDPHTESEWEAAVIGGLRYAQIEVNRHEPEYTEAKELEE